MDTCVWVGPAENAPTGWTVVDSLEALLLLSPGLNPTQIVIDDRAAVLRELDFQQLYTHSPLARITRLVGPWRAGIARTDPVWPLATTRLTGPSDLTNPTLEPVWLPLTSGYDDLAAAGEPADLSGLSVSVKIRDPELRELWLDTLRLAGADLISEGAGVHIHEGQEPFAESEESRSSAPALRVFVNLCVDPWNMHDYAPPGIRIAASYLDSPAAVMQRVVGIIQREPS